MNRALLRGIGIGLAVLGVVLSGPGASLGDSFDPAAFKAKVIAEYDDSGGPVLVEELAQQFKVLELDKDMAASRSFYAGLIDQVGPEAPQASEGERAYLDVLSRFLAARDVWLTNKTAEATDRLGKLSNDLRVSKEAPDVALSVILDDAIAKADNMYIKALRAYDPRSEALKTLIEEKLVPLLAIDYVMASRHSVSIRAMIAAKYAELALLEANYDRPICDASANLNKDILKLSAKYANDLLLDIEARKTSTSAEVIGNDLIYHLQQVAVLSCDKEASAQFGNRLIGLQAATLNNQEFKDQIYVFRHLRTLRKTRTSIATVLTKEGEGQTTEYKPDQSDVVRSFFSPWQLAMYLCKTVRGHEDISIDGLKEKLDGFENVDFSVNVGIPVQEGVGGVEELSRNLDKRQAAIRKSIERKLGGTVFGAGATQQVLMGGSNECGQVVALPTDARIASVITTTSFRAVEPQSHEEAMVRFKIGGFFSFAEAKAVRDTFREIFRNWSVTLGRPRIQD